MRTELCFSLRSHVGILGNEEVDRLAAYSSHLGQTTGTTRTATEGGLRAASKALRPSVRCQPTFPRGTAINWDRHALSAYTWMRTERGPQKAWLHLIGQAENPNCLCDGLTPQSGHHITFDCPLHARRQGLLGSTRHTQRDQGGYQVENGTERPNVHSHGQGIVQKMAMGDRKITGSTMRMPRSSECRACKEMWLSRGRKGKKFGRSDEV